MQSRSDPGSRPPLELWAGVECSVVRVGDSYSDQLESGGHASRIEDLDLIAGLGVRALRYPVLWERTAPHGPDRADWTWADERLGRLRTLGIRPIVGLVHHGSGPRHTSLVDPSFAEGLAEYAGAVAARYPWVDDYTPVNEPLTTARFSGLYGHWYPHGRDDGSFARALIHQCRAVVLSMRAVRRVNPAARLMQTEDLGKTFSTPRLAYQADFENERRWLSFDLLCGRVDARHSMWDYLQDAGVTARELSWFLDNPCAPDIVGVNHYLTSERFLDDRVRLYPPERCGGNGRHDYADVEAVRVRAEGADGPAALLKEAWERFKRPVAVTEAHLGCTREEQMRWLLQVWEAAKSARLDGADIRAVTAWAVLGSHDWDSLLTQSRGRYESGVFDLRAPTPRPTALAGLLQDLAAGRKPRHPAAKGTGWWRRPERLEYPPPGRKRLPSARAFPRQGEKPRARRIAIVGASGALGRVFVRLCALRGLRCAALSRRELDLLDEASIEATLDRLRPWAVVNAGGSARIDAAEHEPDLWHRLNVVGPATLAAACGRRGMALLEFSSDQVFDGEGERPYLESHPVRPRNVLGSAHAELERRVLADHPGALIIRAGGLFSPWDDDHFLADALRTMADGLPFDAAEDVTGSPTYAPDLVQAALDLLIDGERGVWHLANPGALSWADLARRAAELAGFDPSGVCGLPVAELGLAAPRPIFSVLGSERGILLPPIEDALGRYVREREDSRSLHPATPSGIGSRTG